jgi:hypothetical protein
VFQLGGVNAAEVLILRKKLRRKEMVALFVPALARELFTMQAEEYAQLKAQIGEVDAKLTDWHKANECKENLRPLLFSRRLVCGKRGVLVAIKKPAFNCPLLSAGPLISCLVGSFRYPSLERYRPLCRCPSKQFPVCHRTAPSAGTER